MAWKKSAEDRARDAKTYGPEYRRNREVARRRAGGICEGCQHRHPRLECDHIIGVAEGGGHQVENLRMLCVSAGSCQCHERRTAQQGGGFRRPRSNADPAPRPKTIW